MQPNPMAETVRPFLPSLRVCIFKSPWLVGRTRSSPPGLLEEVSSDPVAVACLTGANGHVLALPSSRFDGVRKSFAVLFVADLFHPVHVLAVEKFCNGDMGHRGGWCRA